MVRARRFSNGVAKVVACGVVAGAAAVAATQGACITTPPPDFPDASLRPTILHDSVLPPVNVPLVEWPPNGQFSVPVQLDDPNESFCWVVFIDYNPYPVFTNSGIVHSVECPPPAVVDGVDVITFMLEPSGIDLSTCHQIQFLVAQSFEGTDDHTPTPPGGDDVIWNYVPGGGPECPPYDAGAYGDGAFPIKDASFDSLPLPPPPPADDSGTGSDDASSP
jgi:hypothetical protein